MDAGRLKRAHSLQEWDKSAAKRRRITPSSRTHPADSMISHESYPSPYGGLPDVNIYEEMQPLEHHQQHCLQWKAPVCRLPEATVGTVAQLVSVERHDSPVPMDHPPLVNRQMDRICQPLM
ncbi:hypothetical protein HPB50_026560 [Hyalomma asiaticum]|uniref:Uncharacterized protein n=1 Tax=Hyalomma asiaticum TaxID=266040 RepID=A0ACB7TRM1_HYAAI|nr:hypothetical protein HPB50_026560 [Hyalomma asiaticum]